MTDDQKVLASQLLALAVLKRRVGDLEADLRERMQMAMDRGDRKAGYAGDAKIGYVTLTDPAASWRVTDRAAFLAWVRANRPDEVVTQTIESVRSSFETAILANITGSGEIPDGVDVVAAVSVLQVKPDHGVAGDAIAAELAREGVSFAEWLDSFDRKAIERGAEQ